MIIASFGANNIIAQGNLANYQQTKPDAQDMRNKHKAQQDPVAKLFMDLEYRYNKNYIPQCSFAHKTQIEVFDIQAIKGNMQVDMSSFDGVNSRLKSYDNMVTQSSFAEVDITSEVNRLLA
jgi:hypothetical protein